MRRALVRALGGALTALVLLVPAARAETVYTPAPSAPPPGAPAPPALPPPGTPDTRLSRTTINSGHGTAQFTFYGVGAVGGFECALVKRVAKKHRKHPSFRACSSPQGYRGLGSGRYIFKARAYGPGGFDATPARLRFTITRGSRRP